MRFARPVLLAGVLVAGLGMPASGAVGQDGLATAPATGGEEQVELVTGVVTPYVHEDAAGPDEVQVIDTGDELLPLVGAPLQEHAEVTVELADAGDGYEVTELLDSEPAAEPLLRNGAPGGEADGVHDVHVAFVLPKGTTSADTIADAAQIRAALARVDDYWSSQTAGKISFRIKRTLPKYASAHGCAGDGAWRMWEEADARLGGVRGKPESHLMLVLPRKAYDQLGCSYALGSVGSGVSSGGDIYVVDDTASAIAHELGHNMGLNHSGSLVCPDRQDAAVDDLAGCAVSEYDDYLDVMSSSGVTRGTGALNAAHVDDMGLVPSALVTVPGPAERTVRLSPLGSMNGVRGVKVRVDAGTSYFVQYRTRAGRDAGAPSGYEFGVEVHRGENPWAQPTFFAATSSLLLDATPGDEDRGMTRALPVGATFTSADGRVEVEVLGQDGGSATVAVRTSPAADPGAEARRPAKVAIDAPGSVQADAWFRAGAVVSDQRGRSMSGVDVRLQRRWPGAKSWAGVATVTTGSDGTATLRTRTSRTAVYRWVAMRTDAWAGVPSASRTVRVP